MNTSADAAEGCPFCGSTELEVGYGTPDREGIPSYVYCESCGAQGPWDYLSPDFAYSVSAETCATLTGWNDRSPEDALSSDQKMKNFRSVL